MESKDFSISLTDKQLLDAIKVDKKKFDIERARFKQDCRKKALDFGFEEINKSGCLLTHTAITEAADKYYEWLTKDI